MIERAERASQNLCTFESEKCFTYRPETREKAIINYCEQSNCVCVSETCDSSHTGGVQGPPYGPWRGAGAELLPGAQGAEPPEALEFSANKGIQDGRQE